MLYLGCGLIFEYGLGIEQGFYQVKAIVVFLIALAVACFQNRKLDFNGQAEGDGQRGGRREHPDHVSGVPGRRGLLRGHLRRRGRGQHVFLLLDFLPSQFAVGGLFLISCFVSISMGTSVGTVSALAPFAVSMSEATGYEMVLCIAAVVCAPCSETTCP